MTREKRLEAALRKAYQVLKNVNELFHPEYLLHTDALFKEIEEALRSERDGR